MVVLCRLLHCRLWNVVDWQAYICLERAANRLEDGLARGKRSAGSSEYDRVVEAKYAKAAPMLYSSAREYLIVDSQYERN